MQERDGNQDPGSKAHKIDAVFITHWHPDHCFGLRILLEPGVASDKNPRFDHNADFNLTVFDQSFDFVVARSIWTHASKAQIGTMLDGFVSTAHRSGLLLTSYMRPSILRRDYKGTEWIGRSHESDLGGIMVRHSLLWIRNACRRRGLVVEELTNKEFNFGRQTWLQIRQGAAP